MTDKFVSVRMNVLRFLWEVKNGGLSVADPTGLGVKGVDLYERLGADLTPEQFKAQLDYLEEKRTVQRKPLRIPNVQTKKEELELSWYTISAVGMDEVEAERRTIEPTSAHLVITENDKVFIVHGHNQGVRETVARFLEKLGLSPVILHEQPNKGRTIIEKFVDYSDVSFAVILLTADDRGGPSAQTFEDQRPRARQNVLLELGFFLGKLGRERVCAIYEEGVEIPSDYQGVLFVPMDRQGTWKSLLTREMKEIGLPVDMNRAY